MGATHVTPQEIVEMHRLYRIHGHYSAVGKIMGRSASTVSKYVQMKNIPNNIRVTVENLLKRS